MGDCINSLISAIKVSSVLSDSKEFDKKHLIDGRDDTCWNSDNGTEQYMIFKFRKPVNLREISFRFQGGFTPKVLNMSVGVVHPENPAKLIFKQLSSVSVEDVNSEQKFAVTADHISAIKCDMNSFMDFFGRVIVYQAKFFGTLATQE